jgi:translocation and assembly module TamB
MWLRRILKALVVSIVSIFVLLVLAFIIINIPFSHPVISGKVNQVLAGAHLPITIKSINRLTPGTFIAENVLIHSPENDTIIFAGKIKVEFNPLALLKHKVAISYAEISKVRVNFLRNKQTNGLNISEAFLTGNKQDTSTIKNKKKSWDVAILKADVADLNFVMNDSAGGINIDQSIRRLKVETDKMSIIERTITLASLEIQGATGTIITNSAEKEDNPSQSTIPWVFGLGELNAINTNQEFEDSGKKFKLDLVSGELKIKTGKTDLTNKIIDFDNISILRTNIILNMDSKVKNQTDTISSGKFVFPWDIRGDNINFQEVSASIFRYSDSAGHYPLSNLSLTSLSMNLSDLIMNDASQTVDIDNLNFDLGNGFSLKKMKAVLASKSDKIKLAIEAETAGSKIDINASADGDLISFINNPSELKGADISVSKSSVSLNDLFYFKSDLQTIPVLGLLSRQAVNLDGDFKLKGSILTLPSFSISQSSDIGILFKGKITNIFSPKIITGDIKFLISKLDNEWAKNILEIFKPGIPFPEYKMLTIEGTLSDSLSAPDFSVKLASDLGNMDIIGSFDLNQDKFSAKSHFDNLLIGKIIDNQLVGSFSGSAEINGSGIKNKNLSAAASVQIDSIYFNKYTYTKSNIECKISKDKYGIGLVTNDPSLKLKMNADVIIADSVISGQVDCKYQANLKNLHIFSDTLDTRGQLTADFSKDGDKIKSNLLLSGINLKTPDHNADIENINISFEADSQTSKLVAKSDFLNAQVFIRKPVKDLNMFIKDYTAYVKSLIDPKNKESVYHLNSLPAINGKINLNYSDAFKIFIPDTSLIFRNVLCSVNTNVSDDKINYGINLIGIKFKRINIQNLNVSLKDSASIIDLAISADTCLINSQPANKVMFTSHFANWQSLTNLSVIDRQSKLVYDFEIKSTNDSNNIYLTIPSRKLILNGCLWKMDSSDFLKINRITKALSPSIDMHTDNSFIRLLNKEEPGLQTYDLELRNVGLTSVYRTDVLPGKPSVTISGSTAISINENKGKNINVDMTFRDVSWSDLNFKQASLNGFFSSEKADEFSFDITSRLDTSEIRIKGEKQLTGKRNIDIRFNSVPVNSVQPFVKQFLSDLRGYVSGDFNLSTKDNYESLTGELMIKDVNLKVNSLNSSYRMTEDKILFSGKKMTLKRFKVLDSLNHELFIDGSIDFRNKKSVLSDIEISTSNLQVMNRKEEKKSSFFGAIFVDMNLTIKGVVSSPVLKGKVTLTRGTDIYFRQQDNLSLSESEKVLTFVSSKSSAGPNENNSDAGKSILNKTSIESVVEIDPATRLSIDLSNRMFNIGLVIKGGGNLNYNMLVNKQVNLSGKYEIDEGSADLKMIGWPNKAFRISKGGYIRWDGKLNDPELRLEAINKVTSSYVNPVDNKERYVNFDVTLKLSNRLSAMDVTFSLNTADQYLMSIINTLSPDEQMRQAITILLFENVDLPGISTTSNYVSEQVNQIVASQLNALTKTTIKGIDISFGIDSYVQANGTGGQQTKTSLSYEVKRKLMNDRAQIEVSGRINDGTNQSKSTSYSLNNISFEYKLDSAGTKFLKVYNEHTYEDVFEGEVIKTGVGLTYRKNYPTLSDIWRKDEEKKKRRDEEKKRQSEEALIKHNTKD